MRDHLPLASGWILALLGALTWLALGGPLPWLLGPMLAFGVARGLGWPVAEWAWGRPLGQCLIGVALGLRFTPDVVADLAQRGHWLLLLAALALSPAVLGAWAYRRWGGLSPRAAWLCGLPGGASEMSVLAERHGVQASQVALTQGLRVALVVSLVPWSLSALGVDLTSAVPLAPTMGAVGDRMGAWSWAWTVVWLALVALPTAWAHRRRWPNAWLMLPLVLTAVWCAGGPLMRSSEGAALPMPHLPGVVVNLAQLLLGITLGSKLDAQAWRQAPRLTLVGVAVIAVSLACCGAMAWGLAHLGRDGAHETLTHYLALAPGGMAEMALLARQGHAHLPEVIATHVLRLFLVLALAPLLMRCIQQETECFEGPGSP